MKGRVLHARTLGRGCLTDRIEDTDGLPKKGFVDEPRELISALFPQ